MTMQPVPSIGKDTELTVRMWLTMFLLAVVFVGFLGILFVLGLNWIFILVIAVLMAGFQYFMSDKLVLWTTRAKVVTAEQEPKFHATVEKLAERAGIPKPKKLAIMETHVPNAFATGRNPKNAVVAVTRGLLDRLDESEVEAVLGHELAHVKNRDVAVMTWASLVVIMAGYLMQMLFWMSLFGGFGGRSRRSGNGGQAAIFIMLAMAVTIVVYFISQILIMALSRYREYAADRGGAILTGTPLKLASALAKISDQVYRIPEKDLRQVEHANAFFIIPALKGNSIASLFSSHPPVEKRIAKLEAMQQEIQQNRLRPRQFRIN
ncbi:MAG: zinc metalloprotease HtpX [Chloroflexi bacterium]|nr:zinc metalloprotease HtpX [Chloroflexota bacterium]